MLSALRVHRRSRVRQSDEPRFAHGGHGKLDLVVFEERSRVGTRNPNVLGYNYDMPAGVEYEVDLRQPVGHRIRNLHYKGRPLADDQILRIVLNNLRYGGWGGYTMFKASPIACCA